MARLEVEVGVNRRSIPTTHYLPGQVNEVLRNTEWYGSSLSTIRIGHSNEGRIANELSRELRP
jgi:hypothetical protein